MVEKWKVIDWNPDSGFEANWEVQDAISVIVGRQRALATTCVIFERSSHLLCRERGQSSGSSSEFHVDFHQSPPLGLCALTSLHRRQWRSPVVANG
mmetsp:Transcript_12214/g.28467  ORF Transcript_12214/g.28467 Transcript_12214/m.28467 type:complete len:96 (-) Transcript_12214:729-1016(-)